MAHMTRGLVEGQKTCPQKILTMLTLSLIYSQFCASTDDGSKVIFQNTQRLSATDNLFHTDVLIQDAVELRAMLDSGSMACSLSSCMLPLLEQANVISSDLISPTSVTLIGCGGSKTRPVGVCELQMTIFDCHISVPTLIVDGQCDDLILGSNVIKHLIRVLKYSGNFWEQVSLSDKTSVEGECLLQLLAAVETWKDGECPEKVGAVKLKHAVTLEPMTEHLVWGRLPSHACLSAGSAVVVEPSESRTVPRTIVVGRVVTPLWGDGWVPVRVINPATKPVTLKRNCIIADVSPCVALEDFDTDYLYDNDQPNDVKCTVTRTVDQTDTGSEKSLTVDSEYAAHRPYSLTLHDFGLGDIDIDSSSLSPFWRTKLVDLLAKYESIFSRNSLDCGKAKYFVHHIRLSDNKPFRLPYRRLSPSHYEKLKVALNEMEERDIIRKSTSEYASPLVLVWKKNGDLRLCTDFRWLNARTIRDTHPLPHQADALAALGGNAFFSTMDLTSGYYNVEVHEEDRKFTAFTSPFGLYEYNRLPQGLCNSPATFMRMMMTIFGDQNFLSLLCYLDDILVFAPTEQLALQRLEMVFERLQTHNLKLAPKKCHFMRPSVKFLGHIVQRNGISTDPDKVTAIVGLGEKDLMEEGTDIPSPSKIRSFLGMVGFYQQFFEGYSRISKPLFALTSGVKRPQNTKDKKRPPVSRKLSSADWTLECSEAFRKLKQALLENATLAHPDFSKPISVPTSQLRLSLSSSGTIFFCVYGFPERVHSDQGANFESNLIAEMLKVAGVEKSHTTPYHPMGNGVVERFNRTLGNMIRALPPKAKQRWPQLLKSLTFSYNATVHETTGFAPFQLMFGRTPRLPVDMVFQSVLLDDQVVDYDDYVQCLRRDLVNAIRIAQTSATKQQERQTDLYNRKLRGAPVDVGDRVLLANKGERGRRKLDDRWENHLYTVVEKQESTHTFRLRNCATDQEKVVHRNLIMPVNFLPVPTEPEDPGSFVSDLTDVDGSALDVDIDGPSMPPDSVQDRTVTWVSQLPVSTGDQMTAVADVAAMDDSVEPADEHDQSGLCDLTEPHSAITTPPDNVLPSYAGSVVTAGAVRNLLSDRALDVRTRCGRAVRPVVKLIQNMHQKVLAGR
ncbi:uncharacterized protein [Nerophis lumbriciformis]|uniref:uncharacterized protein n=1 Tax=Nerophis lumbriciformis TaxID=546530 RepID=UPI002AE0B07C|nr:uncharacterized protein LOC133610629 [Nerophis lumbriciformis]